MFYGISIRRAVRAGGDDGLDESQTEYKTGERKKVTE